MRNATGRLGAMARDPGLVKVALIAGGVFLAWKAGRGLRDMGWGLVWLAVAAWWTGLWPF